MAVADTTRYGELCRLCASKTSLVLGINIFENEGNIREINKKIEACLSIRVHETDELPKMVCDQCVYKLEKFFDFRQRSLHTENLLIDMYKELNVARLQNEQMKMNVVMDHPDLIMVQQHHLLNDTIHGVTELDLNQLSHRENMIVEQVQHQIILSHQDVDINAHSLDNISLHHHELTNQHLSNHSLQTQDAILVDESSSVHTTYSEANLELIQQDHQLGNYASEYSLSDLNLHEETNIQVHDKDKHHTIIQENHTLDSHISPVQMKSPNNKVDRSQEPDIKSYDIEIKNDILKNEYKADNLHDLVKREDSNSENRLLIDENDKSDMFVLNEVGDDVTYSNVTSSGDKGVFFCNLCGKAINKADFQVHYDQHFNKCMVCLAVFSNKDALNAHSKEAHGASPEKIRQNIRERLKRASADNNDSNSDSDDLNNSELVKNEEDEDDPITEPAGKAKKWSPKVCKECGKSYKTNYKLTEHMRKHTGEKPYKCSSCEKAFRSKIGLAQHEAKHTGQYDYSCPICGKGFQCKSYLMVHQRVHSDVKPYPCTTCGQNFKSKQSLMDHTNRHLGVKPYMCDICGRGFITKGLCRAHQKVHTGLDNRKYSCKVCNKMFVSKSYLQTHMRIHTGEKPFMCEVCGKGFLTRVDLRIHSTMHTGEKSYVCEMCGKAFARRDALRCHRRSHTGERPYTCDQCGQTFTQFSPMAIHKRLHTGERPYSCEVCDKKFVSKSTMMTHSKKHDFSKYHNISQNGTA